MNLEWISELLNMTKYSNPVDLDFDSMPNETLWTDIKDCKAQMHFLFLYNTGSCGDDDEACDFYNTVPSEKTFYNDEIAMREDDDDWVWKGQDTGVYIYQVDPISGSDVLINGGTKVQDGWHDDVYTGLRLDDDDPLKLQYNLCRDDKCTDLYNDCCAYSGWDDDGDNEQTCAGDYTAVAKSGRTCCLV